MPRLPLFEIARVFVRYYHVASFIVNANHSIMRAAAKLRVVNCVADRVWLSVPQFSKRQISGNQIDAAMITAGRDFVNVCGMPACFTCLLLALMNSAL